MTVSVTDKRQAILDAALKLLATCGFHGFSMKQLASEAHVAAGTVYLYFKDRESLIAELHHNILLNFVENVFGEFDTSISLKQQHLSISKRLWQFCLNNRWILLSKAQFDHLPMEVLKDQRSNTCTNPLSPLVRLYEQGRVSGQLKPLPDDVLFSLSMEPFIYLATQQLLGLVDISEAEIHQMMEAVWDAISQPSPAKDLRSQNETSY